MSWRKPKPSRVVAERPTVQACQADYASRDATQSGAQAIEQRGQVTTNAQSGNTTRSRGLPDHYAGGGR